jgi:hypothetical protein
MKLHGARVAGVALLAACGSLRDDPGRGLVLTGADGAPHAPLEEAGDRLLALIFVDTDCPIANAFSPEITRLQQEFEPRGVVFRLVYPDPDLELADVQRHLSEFRLPGGALLDPEQLLARQVGARVTPEAAVLRRGELLYRGRIDDTYVDYGKRRAAPTRRDLHAALTALLEGRPVEAPRTPAIGCFIPEPPEPR